MQQTKKQITFFFSCNNLSEQIATKNWDCEREKFNTTLLNIIADYPIYVFPNFKNKIKRKKKKAALWKIKRTFLKFVSFFLFFFYWKRKQQQKKVYHKLFDEMRYMLLLFFYHWNQAWGFYLREAKKKYVPQNYKSNDEETHKANITTTDWCLSFLFCVRERKKTNLK